VPSTIVDADAGEMLAPPAPAAQLTDTPTAGFPNESLTFTTRSEGNAVVPTADWASPETSAIDAAAPAVAVAVNVTGEPVSPAAVAVKVLVPAVVPIVAVTDAWPPESVIVVAEET
jgi:hypothetical protein